MRSRRFLALFLVLSLVGSALAIQQQRLYRTVTDEPGTDPEARGVVVIQQHTVFTEIIVEELRDTQTVVHFAAVVGLVKKCKQVRNVFDNAVLWFNDQFLFGNKSNVTVNVTPPTAMGRNPVRNISSEDLLDDNRNNGTGRWNDTTHQVEVNHTGTGPNEGGNPDRDGFIRAQDNRERWGGCFIPNGFVHAIGADDPYGLGRIAQQNASVEEDATGSTITYDDNGQKGTVDDHGPADRGGIESDEGGAPHSDHAYTGAGVGESRNCVSKTGGFGPSFQNSDVEQFGESGCFEDFEVMSNIELTKRLIDLDNECLGCLFQYVASYYITDPNNHRWIVDKMVYPLAVASLVGGAANDDPTNCHIGPDARNATLPIAGDCSSQTDQPGSYEDSPTQTESIITPTTDSRGDERLKLTTKEPLFTVHVQVDPWNPDRQGFPDEAIWRYREDGKLRLGMPYTEDPDHFCHDSATVAGQSRFDDGLHDKADAYEYDRTRGETEGPGPVPPPPAPAPNPDPNVTSLNWTEYRRGPVGNTVECAIEYNFLIAVDFEAFDNTLPVGASYGANRSTLGGAAGAWGNATTQEQGTGENEIIRNFKRHGPGQPDENDRAWQGNSHPHNPQDQLHNADCLTEEPDGPTDQPDCPEKPHRHDAVSLDLFFYARAPYFIEQNPYWDHANQSEPVTTTGTPPAWNEDCTAALHLPPDDYRNQAIEARAAAGDPSVCDTDAVQGFHLHDAEGKEIIPTPSQEGGPTQVRVNAGGGGASVYTGPNGPNATAPP